ncbi:MAG TPA: cyclodeaminase/cyclohydrolase family protein [Solirubrobacteraceae bacterium]|nr:cyclodeaminase/cyclohydrolase family protein [Solirubrobacteraceae bacterium]
MPPLADRTLAALLEEIAAATPAPGGGSTAAVACALAAALVEMSAGPPHERAAALRARALELADEDLSSYAPVLDAERSGDAERVRDALSAASDAPLAIAAVGCEVAELAAELVHRGRLHVQGDAAVAALLAEAATRGAARLVELNLSRVPDDARLHTAGDYAARAWAARNEAVT